MKFIKNTTPLLAGGIAVLLLSSGCMTYQDQRTRQQVREREDMLLVQEDMRRLSGRIETVELEMAQVYNDIDRIRQESARLGRTQAESTEQRLAALERRIQEVDRARETDRREIIDQLSGSIAQLLRDQQARQRPAASSRPAASGYGYEHVVGAGETLSHIASAYGVTTRAIIEANNLQNPDRLQVGQRLFIPE